jgi:hypothetical protein
MKIQLKNYFSKIIEDLCQIFNVIFLNYNYLYILLENKFFHQAFTNINYFNYIVKPCVWIF